MCRGPHEWSTQELEQYIEDIKKMLSEGRNKQYRRLYEGRLESMEEILKERAEVGTI